MLGYIKDWPVPCCIKGPNPQNMFFFYIKKNIVEISPSLAQWGTTLKNKQIQWNVAEIKLNHAIYNKGQPSASFILFTTQPPFSKTKDKEKEFRQRKYGFLFLGSSCASYCMQMQTFYII